MKIAAALVAATVYFAVAGYLKSSYVPQPVPPNDRIWLTGPFTKFGASGAAFIATIPFDQLADGVDDRSRSPLVLYENEHPLGPAHSLHDDIAAIGQGRFSHWTGIGLVFSASDNSDPNANWKRYSIMRP
jgi:hypothetical protein